MSISAICDRFTATLKRQGNTTSVYGDKEIAFSTANRTTDGVPTSVRSDMQVSTSDEKAEYGIKESDMAWCMYTASDPELVTQDQVEWTDSGSVARVCRIHEPSFDMAGRGTIWRTVIVETRTET
tara:strand:- start:51 stop:425 length:375 start_codon:yes stop_codon:yes gene_type:complete